MPNQQYLTIFLSFVSGAFISLFFFWLVSWFRTRHLQAQTDPLVLEDSLELRLEDYATILSDIELGVLAFDARQRMVYINETAIRMLGQDCSHCQDFQAFLARYGHDNGLMAGVVLGKKILNGMYTRHGRTFLIGVRQLPSVTPHHFTTVTVYDISSRENLEKQRKQFVANVSHELKTPLTTLVTYSESLLDWGLDELKPDEVRRDVRRIHDEGKRMQSLVTDLALLTAIDSQGIRPRMDEVDLGHLLQHCVDRHQYSASDKRIQLTLHPVTNDLPLCFGERSSLDRMFNNLIENAIKYTQREGQVDVFVNFIHDELYVKVKDNGMGIEAAHLPLIFNRFFRVDHSGSTLMGGTGLGLSIAKELAELHHGRISVTSTPGEGTEFIVFLPTAYRVFRETLRAARKRLSKSGVLNELAASYLLEYAQSLRPNLSLLTELTEAETAELLTHFEPPIHAPGDRALRGGEATLEPLSEEATHHDPV